MKKALSMVLGLLVGMSVAVAGQPSADALACWSRTEARSYTYTARYEDYDLGGGWWNDNNTRDISSHEGPDCSGLTFKTWAMSSSWGNTGLVYWSIGTDVHGPYNSTSFRDGCGGACYDVCGSGTNSSCGSSSYTLTQYMDGFAKSGHVSLIYTEGSGGNDYFINATGESYGVQYVTRTYRIEAAYDGMRRYNWSSGC